MGRERTVEIDLELHLPRMTEHTLITWPESSHCIASRECKKTCILCLNLWHRYWCRDGSAGGLVLYYLTSLQSMCFILTKQNKFSISIVFQCISIERDVKNKPIEYCTSKLTSEFISLGTSFPFYFSVMANILPFCFWIHSISSIGCNEREPLLLFLSIKSPLFDRMVFIRMYFLGSPFFFNNRFLNMTSFSILNPLILTAAKTGLAILEIFL